MKKNILMCYNIGLIAIFMLYVTYTWISWPADLVLAVNPILLKVGVILPIIGLIIFGYQAFVHRTKMWYLSAVNMASLSIVMLIVNGLLTSSSMFLTSSQLTIYMIGLFFAYAILMTVGIKCEKKILCAKKNWDMKKNILICYNIGLTAIFMLYVTYNWISWPTDLVLAVNPILLKVGVILPIISLIIFGYQAFVHRTKMWYLSAVNMASLSIVMLIVNGLLTSSSMFLTSSQLTIYMIGLLFAYAVLMTIGSKFQKNILHTNK